MHCCPVCTMHVEVPAAAHPGEAVLCRCCLSLLRIGRHTLREMTPYEQNAVATGEVRGELRFRAGRAA